MAMKMSDRDFWLIVRMALIQIVKAIEKRWLSKGEERDTEQHPAA